MKRLIQSVVLLSAVLAPLAAFAGTPPPGTAGVANTGIVPGIPEPASIAVFAAGAALVAVALRKGSK